ncbi:Pantothenate transporter Liz1, partial [Pseudohyphozyma bogoriensis]
YIDQANFANAYVSGLQEDLKYVGNQYTYTISLFNAAVCVCTIPGTLAATKIRPSYWLAGCEVGWMVFTFAQAGATTVRQMYAFRWMIGMFEASYVPVTLVVMASWYTKAELGKRVSLWYLAGNVGSASSGFLQAAIYKTLDGHLGMAGWRWLYIVCGLMTLPSAIIMLWLPDYPSNNRSWLLTDAERDLARARCAKAHMGQMTGKLDLKLLKYIFSSWRFPVLVLTYIIFASGVQCYQYFGIWLKAAHFTTVDRNLLVSVYYCTTIPFSYFYGYMADVTKRRWLVMLCAQTLALIPVGIVTFSPFDFENTHLIRLKEMGFIFAAMGFVTPVYFTWINEICHENAEERAFISAATNSLFSMVNAWLPIVIFPNTTAPTYPRGFKTTFAFVAIIVPTIVLIKFLHDRQERQLAEKRFEEEPAAGADEESMEKEEPRATALPVV